MIKTECWKIYLTCLALATWSGCATYESRPLDLKSFESEWSAQPLDVEPIASYMTQLASRDGPDASPAFDPADGVSLNEAEAIALHLNPDLRRLRANAEIPLASAKEAGWWPDPKFQASVLRFTNRGGPSGGFKFDGGSFNGVNTSLIGPGGFNPGSIERTPPGFRNIEQGNYIQDPWVVNASLSITLPISGRLAVEQEVRWAEYSAAWRGIAIAEWEMLVALRSEWLAWSVIDEKLRISRDYAERIGAATDIANRLAGVGELKTTDARVLDIERARLRAAIQALENAAAQKRLRLLALMGVTPDAPIQLVGDVFQTVVDIPVSERRKTVLESHPRILAMRAGYDVAEQSLRLEIRKQYPDLNIGPSFTLEEGFSRMGLGFGLPIPLWNRNRQAVAQAFAEREAARIRAEATVQQVVNEMAQAETRLTYADERLTILETELAPLVDRQIVETRTLLDIGEVEVLVLREALRASLETKLDILDATLARAQAANALQQMLAPRWVTVSKAELGDEQ